MRIVRDQEGEIGNICAGQVLLADNVYQMITLIMANLQVDELIHYQHRYEFDI